MDCPHAKSDMTPCFLRDEHLALIIVGPIWACVGCERQVHPNLQQEINLKKLIDDLNKRGRRK